MAYQMGLKPWEFWKLTLAEWNLMAEAYLENKKQENMQLAAIQAAIYNAHVYPWKKGDKLFVPDDFMPKKVETKKQQTPEEMLAVVRLLNAAFGGKEV